jgi:hypothetical protein
MCHDESRRNSNAGMAMTDLDMMALNQLWERLLAL